MSASGTAMIAENAAAVKFNPNLYLITVQGGRKYLPVPARLIWFHQEHPTWSIETELVKLDTEKDFAIFKAVIRDDAGKVMSTGHKREDRKDFGDYLEKAETGACGRALGILGYGTEHEPAFEEQHRFADAPAGGHGRRFNAPQRPQPQRTAPAAPRQPLTVAPTPPSAPAGFQPAPERPAHPIDADPRWADVNPFDKTEWEAYQQAKSNYDAAITESVTESTQPQAEGPLICQGLNCGDTVTRAQKTASEHNYGRVLCPTCQKEAARDLAAAPQQERMAA